MKNYKKEYRGFYIHITKIDKNRVDYIVTKKDGLTVEDTDGFCVTIEQAMETCKGFIDDILDN